MHLGKFCLMKPEAPSEGAGQSCCQRRERALTYGVPHDDVHICAEGIVNVLSEVEIQEVTEVVVHVNTWRWERENTVNERRHTTEWFVYSTLPAHS